MSSLRLRTTLLIVFALAVGAALRLWFIHAFPQIQGDSLLYADIARNWLTHGVYGRSIIHLGNPATIAPTLVRLPGYPAFLALCFAVFGGQNYLAILYVQVVIDLATCLLIAAYVRKLHSTRAAMLALWLAVLCPFTANYVAMPLTETLSIFCVALGLYAFAAVLERPRSGWTLALAFAWSYAALLRPDGALLGLVFFPALILYGRNSLGLARAVRVALFCGLIAVLPFVAWTLRNSRTFHVFQPLAPRSATDPGEAKAPGFQRWAKTWVADFTSTYEVWWNVPGDDIDFHALPARAFDTDERETLAVISRYNDGDALTPQIDAAFGALATQRIGAHPFRYYVTLPLLRLADMWLRPRVEMLNIELRWWQYRLHHIETRISYAYGVLNLAYLAAALIGAFYWPRFACAMVAYVVLRSMLLATIEAPEPRYTLECFPIIIAFAAAALSFRRRT
jgi:Dolichyl-phosphate-mannose-protein mannosyltransferase